MKELICIVCPNGCHLRVDEEKDYLVTGNSCPRGAEYGKSELMHPVRVVTATVRCRDAAYPRCPVKTNRPVPKESIRAVMKAMENVTLTAPVRIGDIVIKNICGTGADLVSTRNMEKEN